jgi:Leucine-rich repeat (LRR) protein
MSWETVMTSNYSPVACVKAMIAGDELPLGWLDRWNEERRLSLDDNRLTSVDSVTWPASLQTLSLSDNRLTSVDSVTWPASLQTLYLEDNQITSVDSVTWPASLQTLYLEDNRLNLS